MPALSNPKHEAFCQAYASGENAGNALACYSIIYGKDRQKSGTRASAWRLNHNASICKRVADIQQQNATIETKAVAVAIEKLAITKERILSELAKIGFANMLDYVEVNGRDITMDFSALNRDQAAAISEVTVDTYMEGRDDDAVEVKRVRFKLGDKRAALVDMGKHLGMFVDRVAVTDARYAISDEPPSPEEWAKDYPGPAATAH